MQNYYVFLKNIQQYMLFRKIFTTKDGSTSIKIPEWNEQYHSIHGAVQEAYHVFIKSGLEYQTKKDISILEIGFGTGLNCFITYLEALKKNRTIDYTGIEAYPISENEHKQLNFVELLKAKEKSVIFDKIFTSKWEEKVVLTSTFYLTKRLLKFQEINDKDLYDLIYFDAFGARVQPELWTASIFQKMFDALKNNGVLVTYSAKGSVRRAMIEVGFNVEKTPGPPGKREMLRAVKRV